MSFPTRIMRFLGLKSLRTVSIVLCCTFAMIAPANAQLEPSQVSVATDIEASQVETPSIVESLSESVDGFEDSPVTYEESAATFVASGNCHVGDVWEVSTRHLGCCRNMAAFANPNFKVSHVEQGRWKPRTIEELLTTINSEQQIVSSAQAIDNSSVTFPPLTIFYVHGNWMTVANTRERIMTINQSISRYAKRPYRLVALSWPSERERGFVSDIRENGDCADIQAHYLNYLIQRTSPTTQVSLMGFSFGGRTITGALHLLGGGTIGGLPSQCGECRYDRKFRVTLIAPQSIAIGYRLEADSAKHLHPLNGW